jgi:hypothetical protein
MGPATVLVVDAAVSALPHLPGEPAEALRLIADVRWYDEPLMPASSRRNLWPDP